MFSFSAQPQSLRTNRDAASSAKVGNLMFDPRVRRGTTVEKPSGKEAEDGPARSKAAWTLRRRRPRPREADAFQARPPPRGASESVDLSMFLTEQDGPTSAAPASADAVTQTDEFAEKAPEPHAVAPKRGVDAEVQVEPGELFDFATESQPLVDVIAAKTLEQAMLEVEEEEELAALFQARRDLSAAEEGRLERVRSLDEEALATRARALKALEAARARRRMAETCRRKVLSAAVARGVAAHATGAAMATLRSRLMFEDATRAEVDAGAVEAMVAAATGRVKGLSVARRLADDLLRAAGDRQRAVRAAEVERLRAEAAEAERRRPYFVSVVLRGVLPPRDEDEDEADGADGEEADEDEDEDNGDGAGSRLPPPGTSVEVTLGPIPVARADTAAEVEERIRRWVAAHPSALVEELLRGRRLRLAHSGRPLDPTRSLDSLGPHDLRALHLLNEPA